MQDNTTITFWSGLRTIGGTIISIEHGADRILFDFGELFHTQRLFSKGKKIRAQRYTSDLLKLQALPAIKGIYSSHSLLDTPLLPFEESRQQTAVFISHLHLDHIGSIMHLAPDLPLYMTEEGKRLYAALHEINTPSCEQTPDRIWGVEPGERIRIGESIEVELLAVDHDVIGAAGMLVKTPDVKVAYTGDLRFHGIHREKSMAFIEEVKRFTPDILITEGTALREDSKLEPLLDYPKELRQENDVQEEVTTHLSGAAGAAFFNWYERDLMRLKILIEAAKAAGRQVVLEPESAYLAKQFHIPGLYLVYAPCDLSDELPLWESRLPDVKWITKNLLVQHAEKYFVENQFDRLFELLDFQLESSLYIHTNGTPLGPFDPDYDKLISFLESINCKKIDIFCSGHATGNHLQWLVEEINSPYVVPLHSFHPEKLQPAHGVRILPEPNETLRFTNGILQPQE
ncbi:MBL fold metallo-hydrolase [Sporosarcina sp. Te-1]|uniref:MBL fold metallo-hydrolase n=1 Tax=Sporosarcina sp. Te-1 TaxID=2818390 RepID=UPI001A9F5444|nr:MBL fold metallo-hydrolase [Sporosarcina sp. Te-1]QTD41029.1 MBL fold metallo-hydrolase [Sporosarcina sp. Te-1]